MVRTYWLVPVFNEASGNLGLQPFARIDHVEACRPRGYVCDDDSTAHATFTEVSENGRLMPDIATESLGYEPIHPARGARATGPAESGSAERSPRWACCSPSSGRKAKALILLLPKLKLLDDVGSMLVSIVAYALIWGLPFAVGFVAAAAPARDRPRDPAAPRGHQGLGADVHPLPRRRDRRQVDGRGRRRRGPGRARGPGPRARSQRSCRSASGSPPAATSGGRSPTSASSSTCFNLLPVLPLDGGRAMAALSPWVWLVGLAGLVALAFFFPNPILFLILVFGGMESWRRWKVRNTPEGRAYYAIPTRTRALVAATYLRAGGRALGRGRGDVPVAGDPELLTPFGRGRGTSVTLRSR